MTCAICRSEDHESAACTQAPLGIGQRDFSESEQLAREADIASVARGFVDKAKRVVGKVPFALDAAAMYYAMLDPKTPFWVKATAASALLYFVSPLDAIFDPIPIAGYADDAAVIYAALSAVHAHIKDEHIAAAKRLLLQS